MTVRADDVRRGMAKLGLDGHVVCVHSSLRSFGFVSGGAEAVLDGMLGGRTTILVPTFSRAVHGAPAPAHLRPDRNGYDYDRPPPTTAKPTVYHPDSRVVDATMGAIPAALAARADRARGNHPLCSFTAAGPQARPVVDGQRPDAVYAPFDELVAREGRVLLVGVGLDRMTLLHHAEAAAGRRLFRRWAWREDGSVGTCEMGGCSAGFENLRPVLRRLVREIRVGRSRWQAFDAGAVLEAASAAIRTEPEITRCPVPDCIRCRDAIAGGPIPPG